MFYIKLSNLSVDFNERFRLSNINWQLNDQQHWCITGPNGSGKSALAAILTGAGDIDTGTAVGIPENISVQIF